MIRLLQLNKLIYFVIIFTLLIFAFAFADDKPEDIWEKKEDKNEEANQSLS